MNNKITENIQKEKKWMNTKKVYNLVIKTHTKKYNKQLENEIIRDIRVIFESEKKDYYKPIRIKNFIVIIILSMKVLVIKVKH